ncbi:hypothetical protein SASPL_134551 [Salvia splendens]|uniref:C2 domain-containing protein n=1 Tax=Salvia splendens TaxID=180675 RepID=A0A8X8ZK54_SALSN|nr:hypothetical protein SASPL_134551 [Salvia splendens]
MEHRYPLDKRGPFSHVKGDIALKIYAGDGFEAVEEVLNYQKHRGRESAPPPLKEIKTDDELFYKESHEKIKKKKSKEKEVRTFYSIGTSEYGVVETRPPLAARMGYWGKDKTASTYDLVEQMNFLYISVVKAKDLPVMDISGSLDPYVEVKVGNYKGVAKHLVKNQNPVWNAVFAFSKERLQSNLIEVTVKDKDIGKEDFAGKVALDVAEVPQRVPPDSPLAPQWYKLANKNGEKRPDHGEIMLAVWMGTQTDEAFPKAWHSDVHSLSQQSLASTRSKVYFSPRLYYLRVYVIVAQDLVPSDRGRMPDPYVKVGPGKDDNIGMVLIPVREVPHRIETSKLPEPRWLALQKPSKVDEDGEKKKEVKFASRILLRICIDAAYHVLDESTHFSSDLQLSSKHLRKPSIRTLEVGILSARNLLPMKGKDNRLTDPYCVANVITIGVFDNCHINGKDDARDQRIGKVRIRLSIPASLLARTLPASANHGEVRPMISPTVYPLMNNRRQHRDNILVGTHQDSTQRKPLIPDTSYILLRQLVLEENEPLGLIDHADDNDIIATTKEQVDEVGRTLFFGKTLGAEPKAIGSLDLNHAPKDQLNEFPGLPRARLKIEDEPFNEEENYDHPAVPQQPSLPAAISCSMTRIVVRIGFAVGGVLLRKFSKDSLCVDKRKFTCDSVFDDKCGSLLDPTKWELEIKDEENPLNTSSLRIEEARGAQLSTAIHLHSLDEHDYSIQKTIAAKDALCSTNLHWLHHQAMQIVTARLIRAEPPLRREVVEYMLDVDYHVFSYRRSKANFFRIMSLLSGISHLILPTIFLYLFVIGLWNYRLRSRIPPHMDARVSQAENTHPDELDEEFDTFPTSRPSDLVRMRYDRLRSIAGRVQSVIGDLATQGERALSILGWRDPRATAIFIIFSLIWAVFLYVTPFQVVAVLVGLYILRHPLFRSKLPSVPVNFFKRLPASDHPMRSWLLASPSSFSFGVNGTVLTSSVCPQADISDSFEQHVSFKLEHVEISASCFTPEVTFVVRISSTSPKQTIFLQMLSSPLLKSPTCFHIQAPAPEYTPLHD